MGKRVYCLYRVSTKGQVEKDDIPMQKHRCHEFAAEKGWDIIAVSPVSRSLPKTGMLSKRFSGMRPWENLMFCWSLCLTDLAAKRMRHPL